MPSTLPLFACLTALASQGPGADPDSDRDGLSDFHEVHKYLSDPRKADSDGDGIPDGDWEERREHAYTVRAVLHVMAPFDVASMTDDYQDARALETSPDLLEVEVVVYPFNTVASAIAPDPRWRKPAPALKRWLDPGPCCNWDAAMRKDLLDGLAEDGIELARLDDVEAARAVSKWLMDRSEFEDSFTTFALVFEDGVPRVPPHRRADIDETLRRFGRTFEQQLDRELLGRGMFENRIHGSCTSCAIYLSTGLRAAGIPTRTIVCVPVVDANDEREVAWLSRISHPGVREILERAASKQRGSWTSHTYNEVWVGGRWRRLNYTRLGQNVLDENCLGLMVHVHTFADHSEAGLNGWGDRERHPLHEELFGGPNPYSCVSLSDRVGAHAEKSGELAPAPRLAAAKVERVYWYDDPAKDAALETDLGPDDGAGHFFVHLAESPGSGGREFMDFFHRADRRFVLHARGRADVAAHGIEKYWYDGSRGINDFILRIEPADFARMERGVEYELAWVGAGDAKYEIRAGIALARPKR